MIYNMAQFIENGTTEEPIVNGLDPNLNQEGVYLTANGGGTTPRLGTQNYRAQCIVKSQGRFSGKRLSDEVFALLVGEKGGGRWAIAFPEVTIQEDGTDYVFPAVRVAQILPLQFPAYIGTDVNGLHMYTVNFKITIGG